MAIQSFCAVTLDGVIGVVRPIKKVGKVWISPKVSETMGKK